MDYIAFCKNYYAITGLPVNLIKDGSTIYSSIGEILSIPPQPYPEIFPSDHNPSFRRLSPDLEYGYVQIDDTGYDLFLGPAFSVPITEEIVRLFMRELTLPLDYRELVSELLHSIPRLSHTQFFRHLTFIHLCLNGKDMTWQEFYQQEDLPQRRQHQLSEIVDEKENETFHNTYYFELDLYQHIRDGNVKKLQDLLLSERLDFREGKLAETPLRQAKNLFIGLVAKAGMLGAVPGGMDVEMTYLLIDLYTQECEQLQTLEEISALQYTMIMDFCERTGETHIPKGVSSEVYVCINFIRSHTNEPITIEDVAAQIRRSSSYIMKRFKAELGITINAFIIRCKLEEAKSLLTYSQKSLAEISNYLCFSSQSYFQNLFKKQYQVTPAQYRKRERHV